jgi:hypothetical protein
MIVIYSQNKHWPAYYRLARALHCKDIVIDSRGCSSQSRPGSFIMFFWRCLKELPVNKLHCIGAAFNEYCECRYYLNYIYNNAQAVKNEENACLVSHILQHCCNDLAYGQHKAWGELVALAQQKLLHVVYYEKAEAFEADM